MKKYLFLLTLILSVSQVNGQCLVNLLRINTGFNPLTGAGITPGANGATPVTDPHWIVTAETPGIAAAVIATLGSLPGLTEVTPPGNADIVTNAGWANNPLVQPGGYIGCVNSNYYITDGTGITVYNATLGRQFRVCTGDSLVLDFYIANDNYLVSSNIDGITPLTFSQTPGISSTYYSTFQHFVQTVYLAPGTHTVNLVVDNYNVLGASANPTGLDVYGSIYSQTGVASMVNETDPTCSSYVCSPMTLACDALSLPDSLHPCQGDVIPMPATLTGTNTVLSYTWTPVTGLSSSTILNPTLTAGTSGWYDITVQSLINFNHVINGDFSAGNTGFSTAYLYTPPPSGILNEGYYSVDTDPHDVHSGFSHFGDHTTGTGPMMILNGGPTPLDFWCETIAVTPNTDYDFSAWFANASPSGPGTYPILQFRINGVLIGTPATLTATVGTWVNFSSTWNSGVNTTANICIYDAETSAGGNDFVVDDISFEQLCTVKDSVYVDVTMPDTLFNHNDTIACVAKGAAILSAPTGYLSDLWSNGSTASSISVTSSGSYWVYNFAGCNKVVIDTFNITFIPSPVVNLGNDTAFCKGDTLTLTSVQPAGYTLLWSTGNIGNTIQVYSTGNYWLTVNDKGCTTTDTINVTVTPIPIVDLGPDYLNCKGKPDTLKSSISYVSPTYLWNDASTTPSLVATTTGKYWLQVVDSGCPGAADTINVTILWDTLNIFNHDTAICRGAIVQVLATGNIGQTYQWTPTAGIPVSTSLAPVILPDTSATYILTTSMPLCPDMIDSFHVDVQPVPTVYIGDNRAVCQFDTLRISADVNPKWYNKYLYRWTPANCLDNDSLSAVVFTAGPDTTVRVAVYTPAGCLAYDSMNVIVHPGNFSHLDTIFNVCPHDSVQFRPTGGIAYNWTPSLYMDDTVSSTPWVKAITSQLYTMIATSSFGCKDTQLVNVNVHPLGVVYFDVTSVTLHPGESYQLSPKTNCEYFTWFPAIGLDDAHISNPVATPQVNTEYKVYASNAWGCKVVDSIDILVDPSTLLTLPNAFTPGNGPNSYFTIIKQGIATLKYFRIYNRWGNKVFETTDIDKGWDGTFNGTPQPFDVYIYEVSATTSEGTPFQKNGNVTLIR